MSLVNNMLRDLDQRRKSNAISPATVNLTPVADSPLSSNLMLQFGIVVAAVVLVSVLGYFYLQIYRSGPTTETLSQPIAANIPPATVSPAVAAPVTENPQTAAVTGAAQESQRELQQAQELPATTAPLTTANNVTVPPAFSAAESALPLSAAAQTAPNPIPVAPVQELLPVPITEPPVLNDIARSQALPETAPEIRENNSASGFAIVRNSTQLTTQERDAVNVQEALNLFNRNDYATAFSTLETYIDTNRDAHQSRETYAKLLMSLGGNEQAMRIADEGLTIMPNRPGYKKIKARLMMADNQFEQAAGLLQNRMPPLQDDLEYHELLATALLASRQYADATNIYSGLIRQNNKEGKWWYGLASAYEGAGDMVAAGQAYNLALQSENLSMALRQRSQRRVEELSR